MSSPGYLQAGLSACHDGVARGRGGAVRLFVLSVLVSGAALLLSAAAALGAPSSHPFEIVPGSFQITPSTLQAGAHENLTTSFEFATEDEKTDNDVRTTVVNLPAGFVGNDTAVPTCSMADLVGQVAEKGAGCPPNTQVGTISLDLTVSKKPVLDTFPVYNVEVTSNGVAAELGFNAIVLTQILPVTVRPGDSGLTVTSPDIINITEPHHISVTIWGVPGSHEHDVERGRNCYASAEETVAKCYGGGEEVDEAPRPFLSTPTSCGPNVATMKSDSWEEPGRWSEAEALVPSMVECDRLPFAPSLVVQPTTSSAESPSGLNVTEEVPQSWEKAETLSTANLKDTKLTLPVGYTINPSAGSGLGVCTPQQLETETAEGLPGSGCPSESKIGTVSVETPVLTEKLGGAVYIAAPYDNRPEFGTPEHPGGSLLALYVVVKAPPRGILVKLAGKVEPNPVTGQLVTTFDETPQVPFNKFTLSLTQRATSPLVSPPACGSYTAEADLTPWSEPLTPSVLFDSFAVENGIGGGACPAGGVPPFHPSIEAGTLNNNAGAYSPMDIRIARGDGEQELTRFSSLLPAGLTANLSGIPFCPDADIEAAKTVTGAQEEADPSCPVASEIGHTLVGAGVGSVLAYTPGKIYLAGPYNGAPFSVVSITSAKVGPFDLGTVVIRFALEINPETAVVTVDAKASDPIPHIIDGIVIHVRDIHVYVDRQDFMLNPTSCDAMHFGATVGGGGADPTNPADQQFVSIEDPFQLANCQSLTFKPDFKVSTSGKTSKAQGASLTAKLTVPAALGTQANIREVKVDLPKQLPSRLTTLQKACTAAQFNTNPAGCPAASNIGYAKAITPILPVPLEGPVYFVSHGGEAFPSLEIVLQGYGVKIDLVASTFISKSGITSSTFHTVPDQPVTSFEITLPEGKYSALAANGNLCATTRSVTTKKTVKEKVHGKTKKITKKTTKQVAEPLTMPTAFVAQNGAEIHESTPVSVTGCAKAKPAKKAKKKAKGKGGKKKK